MRFLLSICASALLLSANAGRAQAIQLPSHGEPALLLSPSLLNEAHMAIDRGLDWLARTQTDAGAWSDPAHPALTALPLWAFLRGEHPDRDAVSARAITQILNCVQPDGGIYTPRRGRSSGGLSTYNTAVCITVLHHADAQYPNAAARRAVLGGRRFLATQQASLGTQDAGGFAYATTSTSKPALLNAYYMSEAMRLTEPADLARGGDLDWSAVEDYLRRIHVDPSATNGGGYAEAPAPHGVPARAFRSYGSMTYAGLLTLLYADVDANDPRVRSAMAWAAENWSLDENPGYGRQGIYFFWNVLTKCLLAYGQDRIVTQDGRSIAWRGDVVTTLINAQEIDGFGHGFWQNPEARWMESDPVLATAYAILTLELAAQQPEFEPQE